VRLAAAVLRCDGARVAVLSGHRAKGPAEQQHHPLLPPLAGGRPAQGMGAQDRERPHRGRVWGFELQLKLVRRVEFYMLSAESLMIITSRILQL
jgi:hypothetical protein